MGTVCLLEFGVPMFPLLCNHLHLLYIDSPLNKDNSTQGLLALSSLELSD